MLWSCEWKRVVVRPGLTHYEDPVTGDLWLRDMAVGMCAQRIRADRKQHDAAFHVALAALNHVYPSPEEAKEHSMTELHSGDAVAVDPIETVCIPGEIREQAKARFQEFDTGDCEIIYVSGWYRVDLTLYVLLACVLPGDEPDDAAHNMEYRVQVSSDGTTIEREYLWDCDTGAEYSTP